MSTTLALLQVRAYNEHTRLIARHGIKLTWEQADQLSATSLDWIHNTLMLDIVTDFDGVSFYPRFAILAN